jgi:glycosyltransferase involved in cell wall biosynthesis
MAKNTTLALGLYFNNETNSGVVNYIYNIVAALGTLPILLQPNIILIHNKTAEIELIKSLGYVKIKFVLDQNYPSNKFLRKGIRIIEKLTFIQYSPVYRLRNEISCFYPYFPFLNHNLEFLNNKVEWLVDFNNMAFPHHYDDNGKGMHSYQKELTLKKTRIILSSETLLSELKEYYPDFKNEVKILRFACSIPKEMLKNIDVIKEKYHVKEPYFMSPNQFWEHKNQIVVLNAIKDLKERCPELQFKVIFTGSLKVNRGKGCYAVKIKELVDEYKLADRILFLGLLNRAEQLTLMRHSLALIQPSLYEGWSTLVEEAKALNKHILLTDLPIHREQIAKNCSFFDPSNPAMLSTLMEKTLKEGVIIKGIDYESNIKQYGYEILSALLG